MVLGGLVLLPLAAEALVRGSVQVAQRFSVPPLLIGMTIVAAGTSAPELVTGIAAALEGSSGIVLGNAIGSNIANLGLVLGIAAMLGRVPVTRRIATLDALLTMAVTVLLAVLAWNGVINWIEGLILLAALVVLNIITIKRKDTPAAVPEALEVKPAGNTALALTYIIGGLIGLAAGADILVRGAQYIALSLGISDTLVGATVVALGTSAPELAASLIAARQKHYDIMLGNLLGSCQFNLAAIVGIPALITPLTADRAVEFVHIPALLAITAVTWLFLYTHKTVRRREGVILFLLYAVYITASIIVR